MQPNHIYSAPRQTNITYFYKSTWALGWIQGNSALILRPAKHLERMLIIASAFSVCVTHSGNSTSSCSISQNVRFMVHGIWGKNGKTLWLWWHYRIKIHPADGLLAVNLWHDHTNSSVQWWLPQIHLKIPHCSSVWFFLFLFKPLFHLHLNYKHIRWWFKCLRIGG